MKELYRWSPPLSKIRTVNGSMRYIEWLEAEKKRLTKPGRQIEIRHEDRPNTNGTKRPMVSLWANPLCFEHDCMETATDGIYCETHKDQGTKKPKELP